MNTNTTNTNTSGMSEIRELTDDELDAVNGGAVDAFIWFGCVSGTHIPEVQLSGSNECKGTHLVA
jgi:bacteriocin-like protein